MKETRFKPNLFLYSFNFIPALSILVMSVLLFVVLLQDRSSLSNVRWIFLLIFCSILPFIYSIVLLTRLFNGMQREVVITDFKLVKEFYNDRLVKEITFEKIKNIGYFENYDAEVNFLTVLLTRGLSLIQRGDLIIYPRYGNLGRKKTYVAIPVIEGLDNEGKLLSYYPSFIINYKKFIKYYVDNMPDISVDPKWKNYCSFL